MYNSNNIICISTCVQVLCLNDCLLYYECVLLSIDKVYNNIILFYTLTGQLNNTHLQYSMVSSIAVDSYYSNIGFGS